VQNLASMFDLADCSIALKFGMMVHCGWSAENGWREGRS